MRSMRISASGKVLFLLCLMYGITYVDRVNVSTASTVFQQELNLSNTQLGFVFSAFAYPYLIFQIIGGWVSDRFGARVSLTVCSVIWAGATLGTGLVHSLWAMIFARVMLGFGEGATFPTATRAMSDWMPKEKRGFAQGITHSSARLGNALTPPVVAWLIVLTSWRGSFVILGIISAVWAILWAVYFRDSPADHPQITRQELEALPRYVTKHEKKRTRVPWAPLTRRMMPVTFVYFCYGWTLWLFLSWIPSFFLHNYNLQLKNSALFSSGVFFAGVIGDTIGGVVSDRIFKRTGNHDKARRNLVVIGFIGALVSILPVLFTRDLTWTAICLSAGFFFAEFTIGPMWAIPMDIAPQFAGSASGLMNTGSALAAIISPLVAGYVIDKTGNWELPFLGSVVLLLLGSVLAFWMKPGEKLPIVSPTAAPAAAE